MIIAWLVYILALMIFFVIGWTGVFHAKKYGMTGDLTKKATTIYITLMVIIILITVFVVLKTGADAPFSIQNLKLKFFSK